MPRDCHEREDVPAQQLAVGQSAVQKLGGVAGAPAAREQFRKAGAALDVGPRGQLRLEAVEPALDEAVVRHCGAGQRTPRRRKRDVHATLARRRYVRERCARRFEVAACERAQRRERVHGLFGVPAACLAREPQRAVDVLLRVFVQAEERATHRTVDVRARQHLRSAPGRRLHP